MPKNLCKLKGFCDFITETGKHGFVGPVLMIPCQGNKKCIKNFGLKTLEEKVIRYGHCHLQ